MDNDVDSKCKTVFGAILCEKTVALAINHCPTDDVNEKYYMYLFAKPHGHMYMYKRQPESLTFYKY